MSSSIPPDIMLLLRLTVRLFYTPPTAIIYDLLLEHTPITQLEIITRLKISYREFNRHIFPLKSDQLIRTESQIYETRTVLYYYINPLECYNIIKYKLYKMNENCEAKTNSMDENYKCSICENEYTSLQAQTLMKNFKFMCCDKDLELVVDEFDYCIYQTFVKECGPIIKMLKALEGKTIESLDFLKAHQLKNEKLEATEDKSKLSIMENELMNSNENCISLKELEDSNIEEISSFSEESNNIETESATQDIIVSVNGLKKNIMFITDDDLEQMTESEYENYYTLKEDKNNHI